jgi:aminoglycoside phosphotransferase (APT) family kinase protein
VTPVDPDALRARLGNLLDGRRLASVVQRPCPYRTSYELDEIDVDLADGSSLSLILKSLGRSALEPAARRAKPEFLHDSLREIEVYRSLLEPAGLGTPRFHGAVVEPADDRYWLVIENVAGEVLWQVGELDVWREAARWLAVLHHTFRGGVPDTVRAHLLRYDEGFYASWMERALEFADAGRRSPMEQLAKRYDHVVDGLARLPETFIHGEFYASNVLIQRGGGRIRIAPIDWENAALGAGVVDLAALTTGGWTEAERAAITAGYAEQASALGRSLDEGELHNALELARLHLAVQWLGWDPSWSPPAEHRHDWLGEALAIARRVGLVGRD